VEGQAYLKYLAFVIAIQRAVLDTVDQGTVKAIALGLGEDRAFLAAGVRVPQFAVCQAKAGHWRGTQSGNGEAYWSLSAKGTETLQFHATGFHSANAYEESGTMRKQSK
jgi:hypothetical protein